MLVALSGAGAFVKIPSPLSSIGLDAAPGYLAAFAFGAGPGALVAAAGHLLSALFTGFPLTLPFHLLVALTMAGAGAAAGWLRQRINLAAGVVGGVLLNGVAAPWLLSFVPNPMGRGLFVALVGYLTLASAINAVLAAVVERALVRARVLR